MFSKFALKVYIALFLLLNMISFSVFSFAEENNRRVGPQPDGSILVPTNQVLRPAGFQIVYPGRPVDLALSPNGQWLAVMNLNSIDLVRVLDRKLMQSLQLRRGGASFKGICFSADGRRIYLSQANNRVEVARLDADDVLHWEAPIRLPKPDVGRDAAPGGLTLSQDESTLYVTLSRNNTLGVVSLTDHSTTEIPVGIAPYDVVLYSPEKAYVSNWGGRRPTAGESTYNTSGSRVLVDPNTGIANNGSISVVDLARTVQIKNIRVGLHPTAMVFNPDKSRLYVACANSDTISIIDTQTDEVVGGISVRPRADLPFGSGPNALAMAPDGTRLFVANGTDNAVCVIQPDERKVLGFIPTGWYPGALAIDAAAKFLYVANVKGVGSRNRRADRPGYNSRQYMGSLSVIPMPDENQLRQWTETVAENNRAATRVTQNEGAVPVPTSLQQPSVFKHVVYIIKENRTYDQVFGDLPQGNGDPSLVHFGREVTPNHHALAETFVLLDNFYCSGVLSADGHQWTDEAYVTDYLEKSFGDFARSYPYDGDDALAYASSGFIWDNVMTHGLTFRNYGEFVQAVIEPRDASFDDIYNDFLNGGGAIKISARSNLPQIEPYTCPTYIGFPETVSDAYRAGEFIKELHEFEKSGDMPNFIIMLLPNDHTSGTKPGMPTPEAAVADNDLALGRIVEAISHSRFWPETCIFVTEDDPQAGLDHVDGHRTVGLVISPYTKRGEVVSTNYSQINMFRTIEDILGIPPLNQFDLAAAAMEECFTQTPDFTPYTALPNNIPLDKLNPPLESLSGPALFWAQKSIEQDLDDYDRIDEDTFNRIIWHAVKGYDVPYPVIDN